MTITGTNYYVTNNGSTLCDVTGTVTWPTTSITNWPTVTWPTTSIRRMQDYFSCYLGNLYVQSITNWPQYSINSTTSGGYIDYVDYVEYRYCYAPELSLSEKMKKIITDRCAPILIKDRKALDLSPDIREIRARQTLRRVIGDEKFQNFIKKGFITVRAKSGKSYQIFPGHDITRVYFRGTMIEKLCVVLSGNFPPTDSLIMRFLLILNNEDQFRSLANVSAPDKQQKYLPKEPDKRTLVEIFAAYKKAA